MKKANALFLLTSPLLTLLLMLTGAQAQSSSEWTKEKAAAWYNRHDWLNGLKAKPSETVNQTEFAKQYHANKAGWDKAFAFLRDTDFTRLRIGKYPIDGDNVYATVSEGPPRDLSDAKWEAHHNYSDIHFVVKGKEQIGVMPAGTGTLVEEYNPEKDILFYKLDGGKFSVAEPGMFFIMTPTEAHNPSNKVEGYDGVKKVVVKVKTAP